MIRVLFLCMGNICRSPTAEAVFRHRVEEAGLTHCFEIDSAGTENYHVGEGADARSINEAARCGYDLSTHVARQVSARDFRYYDYLLAMDDANIRALSFLAPNGYEHKAKLFMMFSTIPNQRVVPDPFYGDNEEFKTVIALCENATEGFLEYLKEKGDL